MENKSDSEVQFTVIIIQIPFPMGNGKTELGSIFCGHNIFNPCSIFYRGGSIFLCKILNLGSEYCRIFWTWVQYCGIKILYDTRYVKNAWKIACHHAGIYCYKDIYILSLCKTKRMFKYCCFISAELYVDKRSMQSLSPPFSETILLCKILMFLLLNVFSKLFDSKIE